MSDKQAAILLRQISGRLLGLSRECDKLVFEGERDLVPVWTKDTPEPTGAFVSKFADGWEWRPEGELLISQYIEQIALGLELDAVTLLGEDNAKAE